MRYQNSIDSDDRKKLVFSILKEGRNGILSTISSETPFGYPLGSVVSYLIDDQSIIFMASNMATYVRNFTISEKVCLTVLRQKVDDSTIKILHGVNFFGKVSKLEADKIAEMRLKYVQTFPITTHIINDTENVFYRIRLTTMRYFDDHSTFTIDL